ncbi:helix-turn-helix transcriptional regulator [Pedobacter sp. Leaf132]|uniref:ArsR/SmtB family transcription factor n=1 Tax=Pedobacter sp. Leaf132 TaxID=2876557 RepID=UPI001E4E3395|nr:metalloregulator ArsR/SmtB family transcription factor [Pedobacter sp. Leaf132]
MGLTKSNIFTTEQNEIANVLKALAHPARVAILQHIIKQQACICNDLVEELGLAQATISQHLKELKSIGIIKGNIEGTSVCYCIDEAVWLSVKVLLNNFLADGVSTKGCC